MDLNDGSLSSCGNKEAIMAAAIATATVILNVVVVMVVDEGKEEEEERCSMKGKSSSMEAVVQERHQT